MPRELRYYSFVGLIAILAPLLTLFWFYRQVAIQLASLGARLAS